MSKKDKKNKEKNFEKIQMKNHHRVAAANAADFSSFEDNRLMNKSDGFLSKWSPPFEMFERGNQLFVCADLPGIKRENIKVGIEDKCLTIEGERLQKFAEEGKNFYRSERSYGNFRRRISLPKGIDTTDAKASFKNGVLEISMAAPQKGARGRLLEISDEVGKSKSTAAGA